MQRTDGILAGLGLGFGLAGGMKLSGVLGVLMLVFAGLCGIWLIGMALIAISDRRIARRAARDLVDRIQRERGWSDRP